MRPSKPPIVFFDFDNTISCVDVLAAVIEKYSINEDWKPVEQAWRAGKIGSRECLENQLRGIRATREELVRFVSTIPLDPSFPRILAILEQAQIPSMIVSDSFCFLIRSVLKGQQIFYEPIFANQLDFEKDRLIPSFPFASPDCRRCAHCKKVHLLEHADKNRIYIGDGMSDVCAALEADIVFAKGDLARYLAAKKKPFHKFDHLDTVADYFEKSEMRLVR